jgi:hypothetical protein
MSVPGRIGIILIIALALIDACILATGAKHVASDIETRVMLETGEMNADSSPRDRLLSSAIHSINLFMSRAPRKGSPGI